jgi:multidrug efflux system outer membrane protein
VTSGLILLSAGSCTLGPNYQRPPIIMPTTFKSATTQETNQPQLGENWWILFGDPTLNDLERQAIIANPGLQSAMERILEARAAARITQSQFYPVVTLNPAISRSQVVGRTQNQVQIPFDLSYEVDIWGQIRRNYESAQATAQASADDYEVVLQTLEADVATDYFNLMSFDLQDRVLKETVQSYREQLGLTETLLKAGIAGNIDEVQAVAELYATTTQEQENLRQRDDTEHALAVLLGRPPSELTLAVHPLDLKVPVIPAGLPAELLRRRPDVAEAEQNLVAANAQIGVAVSQFYPTLNLTGAAGFESSDLAHALDWQSRLWSIGASSLTPIFEGGKLEANLAQTQARYRELIGSYRTAVLTAIQDTEDSLTDLHYRAAEAEAQQKAVDASRQYVQYSELEYKQGQVAYLQVIDADRTRLTNELTNIQILNQRLVSTVLLIKALGGGWEDGKAPTTQALPSTTEPTINLEIPSSLPSTLPGSQSAP